MMEMREAIERVKEVAAEFSEAHRLPWRYDEATATVRDADGEVVMVAYVGPEPVAEVEPANARSIVMAMNAFPVLLAGLLAYGDPFNWGYNFITGYTMWRGQRPGYQSAGEAIALAMTPAEEATDEQDR